MAFAFVSYRRQDSSAAARWIVRSIAEAFGSASVFIDTESIRLGPGFPRQIDQSLMRATVLIVVIGRSWLTIPDKYGKRRLDHENDWVRNEIVHALLRGIAIVPILVSGAEELPSEGLPDDIKRLKDFVMFRLDDKSWDRDIRELLRNLEQLGFRRRRRAVRMPTPLLTVRELNHKEIAAAKKKLRGWETVTSPMPGHEPVTRVELERMYEFPSFRNAMRFIDAAAICAARRDHHPRWENMWRTVTVWLSTWDIGQRPSAIDVDMAQELDRIYAKFSSKSSSTRQVAKRKKRSVVGS